MEGVCESPTRHSQVITVFLHVGVISHHSCLVNVANVNAHVVRDGLVQTMVEKHYLRFPVDSSSHHDIARMRIRVNKS
jgi:hypothetical protein